MELAGRNLELCLCPTGDYLPYHKLHLDSAWRAKVLFYDVNHNLGRWFDAMLRLEDATGYAIPPELEAAMLRHLRRFFDNPDHLCLNPPELNATIEPRLDLHSMREGLLALNALARFRHSRWAVHQGRKMLESVLRVCRPDGTLDLRSLHSYERLGEPDQAREHLKSANVATTGRFIEALVWFFETTGDPLAFDLAERFAAYHLRHSTSPDGTFNAVSNTTHTHSFLGTLRGLLLFGLLTRQHDYVDAVAATYRVTVRQIVKESGWCSHDLFSDGRAEVTSAGDAAQIAVWLALHAGYTEYLDDVERIVRARILPSQITSLPEVDLPSGIDHDQEMGRLWGDDEYVNVGERVLGAYGGMQLEPHGGKRSTTDITAAVVHTLVDVQHSIVTRKPGGVWVNFHFDAEDGGVSIRSARDREAEVRVSLAGLENVFLRVPRWAPIESVGISVNGAKSPVRMVGDYAFVPRDSDTREIALTYGLPARRTTETTEGIEFHLEWSGDEIVGVCPNTAFFPFYPTLDGCDQPYEYSSLGTGR